MDTTTRIRIGDWTVIPGLNRIEGPGGSVKLEPRAMDLLLYLARVPGRVISADELIADLWHGRAFDDAVIYKRINQLRKALGDELQAPRYIETIPKRGYRLIAAVSPLPAGDDLGEPAVHNLRDASGAGAADDSAYAGLRRWLTPRLISFFYVVAAVIAVATGWSLVFDSPRDPRGTRADAAVPAASLRAPNISRLTFEGRLKLLPRVSLDGQKVAFSSSDDAGSPMDLYVKVIASDTGLVHVTDYPGAEVFPTWSPDGDRLAFVKGENGAFSIQTVPWVGGRAQKVVDLLGGAFAGIYPVTTLSWSPDGHYLLYSEWPPDSPAHIVRFDLVERNKQVLGGESDRGDALGDFGPSYSPDGRQIAFVRAPASVGNLQIWLMDADGGNARRISELRTLYLEHIGWTSDGRGLLFTVGDGYKFRGFSMSLDDGVPRPLPGLGENDAWPSAVGDRLVYARWTQEDPRLQQVAPRSAIDRSVPPRDFGINGVRLVFSPAGDRIAWESRDGGSWQLWVADRDGGNRHPVTTTLALDPQWSPDGKQIAFSYYDADDQADVYAVDPDTLVVRRLTTHTADDLAPTFSHDGRSIYFCSNREGVPQIYKMPVEGESQHAAVAVTNGGGCYAFESSDGRYLYYEEFDMALRFSSSGPILRLSLDSHDPPVEILKGWPRGPRSWVLTDAGIYYAEGPVLRYLDFASGATTELHHEQGESILYPTVSPDEETVLFSKANGSPSIDLWVIDGFR